MKGLWRGALKKTNNKHRCDRSQSNRIPLPTRPVQSHPTPRSPLLPPGGIAGPFLSSPGPVEPVTIARTTRRGLGNPRGDREPRVFFSFFSRGNQYSSANGGHTGRLNLTLVASVCFVPCPKLTLL
ncbi:Hypothetical protein NTJ_01881 [Nesidiocoris tenuis]|uniref:Uncharacterized protein n=1 Tax=Nesidiocoris tenuis TaxID=355587 RepID=A0ABN7ACK4_9HEMI|nr:Hypothetical protein NTJ_01881 [Nesidiocoris tenuis]